MNTTRIPGKDITRYRCPYTTNLKNSKYGYIDKIICVCKKMVYLQYEHARL